MPLPHIFCWSFGFHREAGRFPGPLYWLVRWSGKAALEWPAVDAEGIEPSHDNFDSLRDFELEGIIYLVLILPLKES